MIQDDFGNLVPSGRSATLYERLEHLGAHVAQVDDKLQAGDDRMTRIEDNVADMRDELAANTTATQELERNTRDLVEFFRAMQGAFKVLNWMARIAKPMAYIIGLGTAALGFWTALKGHLK